MSAHYSAELDGALPVVDRAQVLAGLCEILPAQAVLDDTERQRPFECDGLPGYRELPLVTVLPATTAEVQAVLRFCHQLGVPVVARGAGTGLSGGALPCPVGVLLVLSRLDQVLEIDADNLLARVQPGVRNLAVSEAAAPHSLYYAPDPSSQIACSVGGNVAENAGGVHCLKYGLTVHNVLSVSVVTVAGELLDLYADDMGAANLLALVIGSEGMLGVVTEITVRLRVLPPRTETLLVGFATVAEAGQAVAAIIGGGIIPAGLEMMDALAVQAAEDFAGAGYPRDAAAVLLLELDGDADSVAAELTSAENILQTAGATLLRRAQNEQERTLFWKGRKSAFPAVGRIAPDYYCMDGTIPRRAIADMLAYIAALSEEFELQVANVFHAGDGNLHPLILFDANQPEQVERAEALGGRILEQSVALGGAITGEHGVGREKINYMAAQFSDEELRLFQAIKQALDPVGLLNPGKNIPTLKRCQEYRAVRAQ